jgi:uncharacterized damage-inducible protein DinB
MNRVSLVEQRRELLADRFVDALELSRDDTMQVLEDVTDAEYSVRVGAKAHTIAELVVHLANVSVWWTECVVNRTELSEERRVRYLLTDVGAMNTPPPSYDRWMLHSLLAESLELVLWTFRGMPDEAFTCCDRLRADADTLYSAEWVLYNLLDHEAHHRGQIALIKRMMRALPAP